MEKPDENLFEINPSLYLALAWASHYEKVIIDEDNLTPRMLQEKRQLADKILVQASNANLVDNIEEINKTRFFEKRMRMNMGGKLTPEEIYEFSKDYFNLIDKLIAKLVLNSF